MMGLKGIFDEMEHELKEHGKNRIKELQKIYEIDDADIEDSVLDGVQNILPSYQGSNQTGH